MVAEFHNSDEGFNLIVNLLVSEILQPLTMILLKVRVGIDRSQLLADIVIYSVSKRHDVFSPTQWARPGRTMDTLEPC